MTVPPKFPADCDVERIARENEFYQLYKSNPLQDNGSRSEENSRRMNFLLQEYFQEDKEKQALLFIALNLAPLIVKAGTRFLFGRPVRIEVEDGAGEELQAKIDKIIRRTNLQRRLKESSKPFQYVGHTQFKVRLEGSAAMIEEIPFDHWYPDYRSLPEGVAPQTFFIVRYISSGEAQKFIYVEEHDKLGITYSVFKNQGGKTGEQVSIAEFRNLVPEGATVQGMSVFQKNPIGEVTLVQLDADKDVKDRMGESLLRPILPILHDLNMKLTQVSLQIFKHLDPILEIPAGSAPKQKDGTIQRKKLEILEKEVGQDGSRYVTNDNPQIEMLFKLMETYIEKAARLTETPADFLATAEKGGVEKVEVLKARFMMFFKRIEDYQGAYHEGIEDLIRKALKLEGVKVADDLEFKITFDFGLPKDWEYDAKVWGQAKSDGIASRKTAVARFQGLEGDLLEEEIKLIEEDEKSMPQFDSAFPNPVNA